MWHTHEVRDRVVLDVPILLLFAGAGLVLVGLIGLP